jgi:hypothetical protein
MPQAAMSRPHVDIMRMRVMGLDLVLATGVVGLVIASCFSSIAALAVKARLTAVFVSVPTERQDTQERFALTGEFPESRDADRVGRETSVSTSFDVVRSGSGLLMQGSVGTDAQPFAISFVPAASEDGEESLRWLCGMQRVPAGWHAASAPRVLQLPHGASYSICRDDGMEGA